MSTYHPPGRTAVYRFYDAEDQLLYVGITNNLDVRWATHASDKPWWHLVTRKDAEWFETRAEALAAEKEVVAEQEPLYDATHRLGRGWLDHPRRSYDASADVSAVKAAIRRDVESGSLQPGASLHPKRIAPAYNVAPCSAGKAMYQLVRAGILEHSGHWYRVTGGAKPAKRAARVPSDHWERDADCR